MPSIKNLSVLMTNRWLDFAIRGLSAAVTGAVLTGVLAVIASPAQAVTLVRQRAALGANDQIDWSSLGPANPFNFLGNSFFATSSGGLGLNVQIPPSTIPGVLPPFVFQTTLGTIPTNFANGDFILFTGLIPGPPPAVGNPGPLSITFAQPVRGAGTQIAVDDTFQFTASISAFDSANNLLGTFSAPGTSSLALDNSALFLGVSSDTANIKRLVFSSSVPNTAFGINTLSLATVPVATPEPTATVSLLLLGVFGAGLTLKCQVNKVLEN